MDWKVFPTTTRVLLVLTLGVLATSSSFAEGAVEGSGFGDLITSSGSGDVDTLGGDDGDIVVDIGSGTAPVVSTTLSTKNTNPDDEGGDDSDVIIIGGQEGSGDVTVASSGDGPDTTTLAMQLPPYTACSDNYLYCWCVSEEGLEIPGSRTYTGDKTPIDCQQLIQSMRETESTIAPIVIVEVTETERPVTVEHITTGRRSDVTTRPPYVVQQSTKFGKPADVTEPRGAGDHDGIFQDDDDSVIVDPAIKPLFSHPGILAAVIGGGVVVLLCALLLIMFVVYRMRKKDEGSYPLDPDQKPPRLHTYTRAPTKEFYA